MSPQILKEQSFNLLKDNLRVLLLKYETTHKVCPCKIQIIYFVSKRMAHDFMLQCISLKCSASQDLTLGIKPNLLSDSLIEERSRWGKPQAAENTSNETLLLIASPATVNTKVNFTGLPLNFSSINWQSTIQ